ncbi:unnamed protein product [Cunninghamella echinulata]
MFLGCELLGKKIYCFGGALRDLNSPNPDFGNSFYNNHYVLDLTNFNTDQDINKLKWEEVPPPANGYTLEPRADFAHVKVSDNSYIIFGGAGTQKNYNSPSLKNLTSIYFADSNTWQTIPNNNFLPQTQLNTQAFGGSATMDSNGTVWLFSGISPAPSYLPLNLNATIIKLEAQDEQWTKINATAPNLRTSSPFDPSFHHAAIAMPNGYVYSFGGRSDTIAQDIPGLVSPTKYDMPDGSYKIKDFSFTMYEFLPSNASGNLTEYYDTYKRDYPSNRELHTITQLADKNKFLLYGGASSLKIADNYCYIYDSVSKFWNKITFPGGGPGPRYGHSAITYGNDSLFIMFGSNAAGVVQNDTYLLNMTTYAWHQLPMTGNGNNNDSGIHGLGTGAIVGIAIGSIAVVACIIGGGYFMYRRGVFNTGPEPTQFTQAEQTDQYVTEFDRPTDDKFINPVAVGAFSNNDNNNNNNNYSTSTPSENSYPMNDVSRHNNNNNNNFSSTSSDNGIKVLMKPSETYSDGGLSSPTTSDNYTQYSAAVVKPFEAIGSDESYSNNNNRTKPHARLSSEDNNSTTGLVKPSGF